MKYGKVDMGTYAPTTNQFEAMRWCFKNNILIAPYAKDNTHWYIDVNILGRPHRDKSVYTKNIIWEKLYEYYEYYYEKREK